MNESSDEKQWEKEQNEHDPEPDVIDFKYDKENKRFEIVTDYGPKNIEKFVMDLNEFIHDISPDEFFGWFSADLGPFGCHGGRVITSRVKDNKSDI